MDDQPILRAFTEADRPFLERIVTDPEALGPFVWPGFKDARSRSRRWEKDGYIGTESAALAVVLPDDSPIGIASWEAHNRGGAAGGCYEIGLALLPGYRGRGLGTAAQRLLVEHLFTHTIAHRVEAQTDADNIAEHKALERIGFRQEGLLRGARFRRGRWQDMVIYGILRDDFLPPDG
jgi:ribosomal-protein-alanine N-acetyltransferase